MKNSSESAASPQIVSSLLRGCAVVVLLLQVLAAALVVGRVSDHYGVVFGMPKVYASMDAAEALRTVRRSSWWEHNGYRQYGPLYFRSAWTLDKLDPLLTRGSEWKWGTSRGRHYHAALLMVNLLSLVGLACVISCMLTRNWTERLIGTSVLLACFQFSEIWCWAVLVAKPENFICFLTALGALWAWRLFPSCGTARKPLLLTGLFFGLAMATKLSTLVYLAVLPLCFLPPLNFSAGNVLDRWAIHRRILPGLLFLALVFVVYLAVGWPQNANFSWLKPYLHFMAEQNNAPAGTMPDMEWGRRLVQQAGPPLVGIVILSLLWRTPSKERPCLWLCLRAAVFAAFPIAYMFTKRVASPSEHYLMQYIASALVMVAGLITILWPRDGRWDLPPLLRQVLGFGLLVAVFLVPALVPNKWGSFSHDMLEAKELSQRRYEVVTALQRSVAKVYVDPYVSHEPNLGTVFWTYRANLGLFDADGPDVMVFTPVHYQRFLDDPPNYYTQRFFRSWPVVREFYQLFEGKEQIISPDGREWIRSEQEGLEIWTRTPLDGS